MWKTLNGAFALLLCRCVEPSSYIFYTRVPDRYRAIRKDIQVQHLGTAATGFQNLELAISVNEEIIRFFIHAGHIMSGKNATAASEAADGPGRQLNAQSSKFDAHLNIEQMYKVRCARDCSRCHRRWEF